MISTYAYTIYNVYNHYTLRDKSISSILKKDECDVFESMMVMGFFAMWYEYIRKDLVSLISISGLLIGIYVLLIFDYTHILHSIFCVIAFVSILVFMFYHSWKNRSLIFGLISLIQVVLSIFTPFQRNILNGEIYMLLNFCIFYLALHSVGVNHETYQFIKTDGRFPS